MAIPTIIPFKIQFVICHDYFTSVLFCNILCLPQNGNSLKNGDLF